MPDMPKWEDLIEMTKKRCPLCKAPSVNSGLPCTMTSESYLPIVCDEFGYIDLEKGKLYENKSTFVFPMKNFEGICKFLKWFLVRVPTVNGFFCEGCLTHFHSSKKAICLFTIVDRVYNEDPMIHNPGRILPCCSSCGIKYGIISQKELDNLNDEILDLSQNAWNEEKKEIRRFHEFTADHIEQIMKGNQNERI